MFTSSHSTKLIAISVALGLFFTSFMPLHTLRTPHTRECYLPSPAADSSLVGESFGSLTVIESDEVEFSLRFLEWLKELF